MDDENQVYYYNMEVATALVRTKRWLQRWKARQRENQRYRAKITIATLLPHLIEKKRRRRLRMNRRIRVENQGYAVYKITKQYKQQVLSIWVHATIEEKFRRIAYKIVLQIRHARKELVDRVKTWLRESWHRRCIIFFVDRWKRFVGYIYKHASRIARFFQSLRSRKLGKKLRKHLRVLRRALQPVITRHFFRRFANGCLLQHQERYLVPLMQIVKRFLMLGTFYRWLKGTRHQRFVRVCMWRRRHLLHSPRSVHDTELTMQTMASVNANNTALLDSSYSAPLLKAFHVWLNCAQALRLYKQQAIYAIAHDGIVNGGIRRAMSWHDRATIIQCMFRSSYARQRTKLQRKYCHVYRVRTLRLLDCSMTRFKRFMLIARKATSTLQRVFRQQASKKLAMVVMDSQKQKDLRLNRYATVCEHNQRFRLLQKTLCIMQFTYALRQMQMKRQRPTNMRPGQDQRQGQGQERRYNVSVRDGNDNITISDTDDDDGDYCVPSIRRQPVDDLFVPRSSSSSPLVLYPPDDQRTTMDISFRANNSLSRNAVSFKGDKDVSFGPFSSYNASSHDDDDHPSHDDSFHDTPYDDPSYNRNSIPSRHHPTHDPSSHISRSIDTGGGKVSSSGGRWGPGGGRLSVHSLGSSLSNNSDGDDDDDSSKFLGSVHMTTTRSPGGSKQMSTGGRTGLGLGPTPKQQQQQQGLSKRHKAMMLSEHPVWDEMTGMSHGDGVHSIALALPDINMNIHASAAAAASFMRTISRRKKDRKSSTFSVSSGNHQGGDDIGSRGYSTRPNSPERMTYQTALTPQEKKMFLRDEEDESVRSHTHSRVNVNDPNLYNTNPDTKKKKHGSRHSKHDYKNVMMMNKRMAYNVPDLTMYQPSSLAIPAPKQQQQQQGDINQFRFDKFDQKSIQNPRSHSHAQPPFTTNNTTTTTLLRHSQSAQGVRSRPLASSSSLQESVSSLQPQLHPQQAYQGNILMSRTFSIIDDERSNDVAAPPSFVGLRKAFTAFAPTYNGAHRQQQQQQQQQNPQSAFETIGNIDFESTEYHSQAFTLRKTGVFTLVTSQVVLTRVETETCLRDADTVICRDLNHPRAFRDIGKYFQGKKLILIGGHVSEKEIGYLSEAWRARPRDAATAVPFTLQLNQVQCVNHRTQLRLIAGMLTMELDEEQSIIINDDDMTTKKNPHNDPATTDAAAAAAISGPSLDVHISPSTENRMGVLAMNLTSQFKLRMLICDIASVGCLGMVCLLVGLKYNTTVEILALNFDPSISSQQGLLPSMHDVVTTLAPGLLPSWLVPLLQRPVPGIPPVISDCLLFLQDNRSIQELSLRGNVLTVKVLKSLYDLIVSGGLPSMTRLEYMVSRNDAIAMRLSQKIVDVAELRKQQQPQHPTVVKDRKANEGVGLVDQEREGTHEQRMNAVIPLQQHVKLQPLEVDVAVVG